MHLGNFLSLRDTWPIPAIVPLREPGTEISRSIYLSSAVNTRQGLILKMVLM
jgi:hypothetical protein